MGFLLLSVQYPTNEARKAFFQEAGPSFMPHTAALYEPLPFSATTEEWRDILRLLEQQTASSLNVDKDSMINLHDVNTMARPLKPNDDNYAAFTGPFWKVIVGRIDSEVCARADSGQCTRFQRQAMATNHQHHRLPVWILPNGRLSMEF